MRSKERVNSKLVDRNEIVSRSERVWRNVNRNKRGGQRH